MNHLDLFSGIGGFALAASWVWPDHKPVAFCEIDPFCQKVLKKHWPDVPIYSDVKKLKGFDFETVDLVSGGFPCQPFSAAGKRAGTEDDRFLWPEMLRVIREVHPRWVLAENVSGLVSIDKGLVLKRVLIDLEGEGYQVQPFVIPACAVGAPHRRDRIWIVAHSSTAGTRNKTRSVGNQKRTASENRAKSLRQKHGQACTSGVDPTNKHVANTKGGKPRQQTKQKRREDSGRRNKQDAPNPGRKHGQQRGGEKHGPNQTERTPQAEKTERCNSTQHNAPNPRNQGLQGRSELGEQEQGWKETKRIRHDVAGPCGKEQWNEPWIEAATRLCRVDDGVPRGMDRTNRLKALGNAIVPQVAAEIFKAIRSADNDQM